MKRFFFFIFILMRISFSDITICQIIKDNHLLSKVGELKLPLSKQSSAFSYNLQIFSKSGENFLFVEQTFRNTIDIYNLNSKTYYKTIRLPKAIAPEQPIGFFVNNFDSIYVLLTKSNKFVLLNSSGVIMEETKPLTWNAEITPVIFSNHPVIKIDRNLLICSYFSLPNDLPKSPSCIIFNMNDKTIRYDYPVSLEYKKGWWGKTIYIPTLHQTYNRDKKLIVHSFPVDNYIYVYDKYNKSKKYFAGSQFIKKVYPVSKQVKPNITGSDVENHFARSGYYTTINYDKYQNIYYRYLVKPVKKGKDFTSKRDHSIIILDKNFINIGEWEVPDKNDLFKSFIYRKGLYILNTELYQQNQDTLCFDIYHLRNSP